MGHVTVNHTARACRDSYVVKAKTGSALRITRAEISSDEKKKDTHRTMGKVKVTGSTPTCRSGFFLFGAETPLWHGPVSAVDSRNACVSQTTRRQYCNAAAKTSLERETVGKGTEKRVGGAPD